MSAPMNHPKPDTPVKMKINDDEESFRMTDENLLLAIWALTKVPPEVSPRQSVLRCIERVINDWYDNFREAQKNSEDDIKEEQ